MANNTRQSAELLKAAADPNRLRILKCLQVRPACVCELVQATGMPQPRVSRHLKVLRDAGLVTDSREAQWVLYALTPVPRGTPEADLLALVARWLEEAPQTLADRERLSRATREQYVPG